MHVVLLVFAFTAANHSAIHIRNHELRTFGGCATTRVIIVQRVKEFSILARKLSFEALRCAMVSRRATGGTSLTLRE